MGVRESSISLSINLAKISCYLFGGKLPRLILGSSQKDGWFLPVYQYGLTTSSGGFGWQDKELSSKLKISLVASMLSVPF